MTDFSNIEYRRNFINQVICRMDFLEYINTKDIFDNIIQKEIIRHYSKKEKDKPVRFGSIKIDASGDQKKPNITDDSMEGIQQTYVTSDGANKLVLSNKYLIIETNTYTTFEEMMDTFEKVVSTIFKKNQLTVNRTGIRYINVFDTSQIKVLKGYFNPLIGGSLNPTIIDNKTSFGLTRSMHLAEYTLDNMTLNFRFGLFNKNYPGLMKSYDFVLDYDCFTTEPFSQDKDILNCINASHDYIQAFFEGSITDKLRMVMSNE